MVNNLEIELETYEAAVKKLLVTDADRYVLIRKTEVVGTYDSYNDALKAGYEKFGIVPFFVKKIAYKQVEFFSRDIVCST